MSFTASVSAGALASALARVAAITPTRTTIPILEMVRLRWAADRLELTATDLDQALTVAIEGEGSGAICAPARELSAFVGRLDRTARASMELSDHRLVVKQGRARARLPVIEAVGDFPDLAAVNGPPWSIDGPALAAALRGVAGAVSDVETRYYLHGAFFHLSAAGGPVLVTTDGHRLAREPLPGAGPEGAASIILPSRSIPTVAALAKGAGGPVALTLAESGVVVIAGDARYVTKVIDGSFPDYTRVIPKDLPHAITFSPDDAKVAFERVAAVPNPDKNGSLMCRVDVDAEGVLSITASDANSGEAADAIGAEVTGTPPAVGFNLKYMAWAVASLEDAKRVALEVGGAGDPVIFRAVGGPDASLRIVMPIRLGAA